MKWRNAALLIFSYIFYGWYEPLYCLLLLSSTAIDYVIGLRMAGARRKKSLLLISIVLNLGMLCFFKYYHFFVDNYNFLSALTEPGFKIEHIWAFAVPIGISFYTFQSMSYSIDIYRRDIKAERNFVDFACYVSMFPQLIAGPILRYDDIRRELKKRTVSKQFIISGVGFICCGLFKKVVLGDSCGLIADTTFGTDGLSWYHAWTGLLAFSFQIYFDFSGYCDIAVGLGFILGFTLPDNFRSPYRASSMTDFWHRWHITFSNWLRDYLYIPLGGNQDGPLRTTINLFIVMFLGGLWHGASWNFAIWGICHGMILGIERVLNLHKSNSIPSLIRTFLLVTLLWVFFRAETFTDSINYFAALFGSGYKSSSLLVCADLYSPFNLIILSTATLLCFAAPKSQSFLKRITNKKAVFLLLLFIISIIFIYENNNRLFIYFRF